MITSAKIFVNLKQKMELKYLKINLYEASKSESNVNEFKIYRLVL